MRFVRTFAALGGAALALTIPATMSATAGDETSGPPIKQMRERFSKYMTPEAAMQAGYLPDPICAESPEGVMGHHFLNPWKVDSKIFWRHPEVLVYQPIGEDGDLRLVAVEYVILEREVEGGRPHLKGGVPFKGPMPGHSPGMPVHYDLHAWLFQHNPEGIFADWNPKGTCDPKK